MFFGTPCISAVLLYAEGITVPTVNIDVIDSNYDLSNTNVPSSGHPVCFNSDGRFKYGRRTN